MPNTSYQLNFLKTKGGKVPVLFMHDPSVSHTFILGSVDYGISNEINIESAHAVEHLIFAGTKRFPSKREISNSIADLGGKLNARTSDPRTSYHAMLPAGKAAIGIDLITDLMFSPLLKEEDLPSVKKAITVELGKEQTMDPYKALALFYRAYFAEGTYGYKFHIEERLKSLESLTIEQLRADYNSNYAPANAVFSIGGNFDADEICTILSGAIDEKFEARPAACAGKLREYANPKYRHLENRASAMTEFVLLGVKAADVNTAGYYPMNVLNYILGGKPGARIPFRLREEEHLSYGSMAAFTQAKGHGIFTFYTDTMKGTSKKAEGIIVEELARIRAEGPTEQEVESAKTALAEQIQTIDGTQNKIEELHSAYLRARTLVQPEEKVHGLQSVKLADVIRVVQEVIPAEFTPETYASARLIAE